MHFQLYSFLQSNCSRTDIRNTCQVRQTSPPNILRSKLELPFGGYKLFSDTLKRFREGFLYWEWFLKNKSVFIVAALGTNIFLVVPEKLILNEKSPQTRDFPQNRDNLSEVSSQPYFLSELISTDIAKRLIWFLISLRLINGFSNGADNVALREQKHVHSKVAKGRPCALWRKNELALRFFVEPTREQFVGLIIRDLFCHMRLATEKNNK